MPTRREVAQFLSEFSAAITLGFEKWIPRSVDRHQQLIDLGMTQNLALNTIRELGPDNYSSGPDPDDTNPGRFVWVFGVIIEGVEVYINLALQPHEKKSIVYGMIWSFHKAEFRMDYPLRVDPKRR
ncbi:MAG: hypothetical protein ABL888_04945 [Pirellulaceae bacterium]